MHALLMIKNFLFSKYSVTVEIKQTKAELIFSNLEKSGIEISSCFSFTLEVICLSAI